MDLDPQSLAALLFGLLLVLATVVIALWAGKRARERLAAAQRRHAQAMDAVGKALGLELIVPEPYEHPLVGDYGGWASVSGLLAGVRVELGVSAEDGGEGPTRYVTAANASPAAGRRFQVSSWLGRERFALPRGRDSLAQAAPRLKPDQLDELQALAEEVVVRREELSVLPKPTPRRESRLGSSYRLLGDVEALSRLLQAAAELSRCWETEQSKQR